MQIAKLKDIDFENIIYLLNQGGILVYPTETCYGLGCDPTNKDVVEKIYQIKKRPKEKLLLCVFPNVESVKKYVEWNNVLQKLSEKYWPGALTIVAKIKAGMENKIYTASDDGYLSFRISDNFFVQELCNKFDGPIVSTSANISSTKNLYDSKEVTKMFENEEFQPDLIIDAGILPERKPSTIVKISGNNFEIIRQGEIEVKFK